MAEHSPETCRFIKHLGRGGYGYYWIKHTDGKKETIWFDPETSIPNLNGGTYDAYFGVNPSSTRKGINSRATVSDVMVVNCLYAEFDAKDFNDDLAQALAHIEDLYLPPGVIVASGGGYHCYWLLERPHMVDQQTANIQKRWVEFVGGDRGAHDLARVLRVPGTINRKYNPPRPVTFMKPMWGHDSFYEWEDLVSAMPPEEEAPVAIPSVPTKAEYHGDKWLDHFVSMARGAHRNQYGFELACQLRDDGLSYGSAQSMMLQYAQTVRHFRTPEYTEREAMASLRQAYKHPRRSPAINPNRPRTDHQPTVHQTQSNVPVRAIPPEQPVDVAPADDFDTLFPLRYLSNSAIVDALNNQEVGDAELFGALFAGKLLYDHAERAWYSWSAHYWKRDETGLVYRLVARRVAPQYFNAASIATAHDQKDIAKEMAKRAAALRNKGRMDNVLYLAARHQEIAITGNEWDQNGWLLGCPNGVINLHDGSFRPGKPTDYIRAHTEVEWQGIDQPCPRWEKFISEIFAGDAQLVLYCQRLLGYGITGLTTEHIMPILWGEGRNGKSTLLETLGDVLSHDLAASSQADALMDAVKGGGDGPKPFMFALRGKRLVWASESNEGRKMNAGMVKQLTGGDRLNVRTLHSKPVEFNPTHLLMLLTNNKPHIAADDQAMWDRVRLIPFTQRFVDAPGPGEQLKDARLKDKLRAELPGILAWLVRGCLAWQNDGLGMPDVVRAASEEYRSEEDTTGQFISEKCVLRADLSVYAGELYAAYAEWCRAGNISPMTQTSFGKWCKKRFAIHRSNGIRYLGLALR